MRERKESLFIEKWPWFSFKDTLVIVSVNGKELKCPLVPGCLFGRGGRPATLLTWLPCLLVVLTRALGEAAIPALLAPELNCLPAPTWVVLGGAPALRLGLHVVGHLLAPWAL